MSRTERPSTTAMSASCSWIRFATRAVALQMKALDANGL
jgi:hypothetical protein